MCGYKLPITGQNVAKKRLAQAKMLLLSVLGGYFFDSPSRRIDLVHDERR